MVSFNILKMFSKKQDKPEICLTDEEFKELQDIEKTAYIKEAKSILETRGKEIAKRELILNKTDGDGIKWLMK